MSDPGEAGRLSDELDVIIEYHGINGGMINLAAFSPSLTRYSEPAMNDNAALPRGDQLITRTLTHATAIETHLTTGAGAMLRESGLTPHFRAAVQEFLKPALALLAGLEQEVVRQAQLLAADAIEGRAVQLSSFAEEFERQAKSPAQWKLAVSFKAFVGEITRRAGKEQEHGKEVRSKALDFQRE